MSMANACIKCRVLHIQYFFHSLDYNFPFCLVYPRLHAVERVGGEDVNVCDDDRFSTIDLWNHIVHHATSFSDFALLVRLKRSLNGVCAVECAWQCWVEVDDRFSVDVVEEGG